VQLVHYGHSCVLVETDSARLLFDPGMFSTGFEDLRDLDAVLITHQHPDHLDVSRLPALLQTNPNAKLIVDPGSAAEVGKVDLAARVVSPGESLELAGASVHAIGGNHAVIHPEIPVPPNVGYVVEHGAFYHPGDSFYRPDQEIDVLGLPTGAPWLKLSEAIDFLRMVKPRVAVPIHQAVLAMPQMHYGRFSELAPTGTEVRVLTEQEPTGL
jgi:L-ascorbate metabolism protein UlaG (beta-lactamase superfamily)